MAPGARRRMQGFNLIELMIGIAIMGVLITIGLPNLSTWLQNAQIRTAADGVLSGLNLARAEALRRNAPVRFQFTTTLDAGCALSTTGRNWVVSLADPTAQCNVAPSETAAPQILQAKSSVEGTPNAVITATGGSSVTFNGLGRASGAGQITAVDITNTTGGACQTSDGTAGGPMRCLRVQISAGGQTRLCDPAVTSATDPRFCP
jgi:type IV fimbrial biogenesis protein FimT